MNRRGWLWLTLPILAVLVITFPWWVGAVLIVLDDLPHNGHARAYTKDVQVHQGYQWIGTGSEGNCNCSLTNYYVGPAGVDPASVFTGPNLTVEPWPPGSLGDTGLWEYLLRGTGDTKRTGECTVHVNRYRHGYDPLDSWDLSDGQRGDFEAGKLEILALYVGCERDGR